MVGTTETTPYETLEACARLVEERVRRALQARWGPDCDDAIQDMFEAVIRQWHRSNNPYAVKAADELVRVGCVIAHRASARDWRSQKLAEEAAVSYGQSRQCDSELFESINRLPYDLVDVINRASLSDREHEALMGSAQGRSRSALASEMGVSKSTITTYVDRARQKLLPHVA